jgi:hypothetical protein
VIHHAAGPRLLEKCRCIGAAYAYPLELATEVAIASVRRFIARHDSVDEIIFCFYVREHFATYTRLLGVRTPGEASAPDANGNFFSVLIGRCLVASEI